MKLNEAANRRALVGRHSTGGAPLRVRPDGYRPERVPKALKVLQPHFSKREVGKMGEMVPRIVEHGELKLIGIPCISLDDMSGKYRHAKEGLLSSTKYFDAVKNPSVHYGIWPEAPTQAQSDRHAYILCVEVDSFDGIPEWYFKTTLPPQQCVVVANKDGDFTAASEAVDEYVRDNGLTVGAGERKYIICEAYDYEREGYGFMRYSLPIQTVPDGVR